MVDDSEPGVEQDARATDYRETALRILDAEGETLTAIVFMLAALEARVEELTVYVAQMR